MRKLMNLKWSELVFITFVSLLYIYLTFLRTKYIGEENEGQRSAGMHKLILHIFA